MIGALIFDFDGLILDTETPEYHAVAEVFEAHGAVLSVTRWQAVIGTHMPEGFWLDWLEQDLGRAVPDRAAVRSRTRVRHLELVDREEVRPGVADLLDAAERAGVAVGIASSSHRDWLVRHLGRLGLLERFPVLCGRDSVAAGGTKPAPDLYLTAAARIGTEPARCVALEDSRNGSLAAKSAGMACVVCPGPLTAAQDFGHADLLVDSLARINLASLAALRRSAASSHQ